MPEWPAAQQRPPGYPAALPFVPGSPVRIEEGDGVLVMTWLGIERPADLFQQLIGACVTSGWRRTDAGSGAPTAASPGHAVTGAGTAPSPGDALTGAGAATSPGNSPITARFSAGDSERIIEAVHAGPFSFVTLTQHGSRQT